MITQYRFKLKDSQGATIVQGSVVLDPGSATLAQSGNTSALPVWNYGVSYPGSNISGTMCITYTPTFYDYDADATLHQAFTSFVGGPHAVGIVVYPGRDDHIVHVDPSLTYAFAIPIGHQGYHPVGVADGWEYDTIFMTDGLFTDNLIWPEHACCLNPCISCDKATIVFEDCCLNWSNVKDALVNGYDAGVRYAWCGRAGCAGGART